MSVAEIRQRTAEKLAEPEKYPCRNCTASTQHDVLAKLGGLCTGCYRTYCIGGNQALQRLAGGAS